ncbi:pilus assembly protein [Burkholderia sp. Bp8963]|uniref:TadE/TadG family type IV pilus assembly protein n=1 Tax=Burkholderia sp. Bp8963 TaxID=2184547 RepID=UPI000F5ADE2F|nr:TadE/TadG family type IV pilus assembly protein [Burkholderia sp. Bp8963]RQS67063.1 pilus assembly protein [Burkholderia sp. Bp8963]
MRRHFSPRARRRQRGATAVEFALVFPMFFLIFYAIVTFGLIFAVQQNLTLAASEGARAALNYVPGTSTTSALTARAQNARGMALAYIAPGLKQYVDVPVPTPASCSYDPSNANLHCVTVTVTYRYKDSPLVPNIPLLGMVLPNTLTSSATVQIPDTYL